MSTKSPEKHHYQIILTLSREFLKWVYTHRLIGGADQYLNQLWATKPSTKQSNFGGKFGRQFTTLNQVQSFNKAFDDMLTRRNIGSNHKHPLLYFILFLGEDIEQQSIENNLHNNLNDYARFLLDMISDSLAHIKMMRSNSIYQEVYDATTNEILFAKKDLFKSLTIEDIVEYLPHSKNLDDVVRYLRVPIYEDELYVPEDVILEIRSNKARKLISMDGSSVDRLELPKDLMNQTFKYITGYMLAEHKRHNTKFYIEMIKDDSMLSDFKTIYSQFKRHSISNVESLARLGTIIGDYLYQHNLCTNKRATASFLFEYFALFKVIKLKQAKDLPESYEELIPFYIHNGINAEKIRNMMKDVGDF